MELRANAIPDRAVRTRVEELEEEVRQLRKLLMPVFVLPPEWELTAQESEVLRLLATKPYVNTEMATASMDISPKTLGVLIHRVRKKVLHVTVHNIRDRGFYLEPWDKEFILRSANQWIKEHEIEMGDHMNLVRMFEMVATIDVEKLERVAQLVRYVQKILKSEPVGVT